MSLGIRLVLGRRFAQNRDVIRALLTYTSIVLASVRGLFRWRGEQAIVELALRQQLASFAHQQTKPRLTPLDRAFWVALSRIWPPWKGVVCMVQPETVVRWRRKGFRLYWRSISRRGPGRPPISPELQALIRRLREAFPGEHATRFLVHDNDAIFSDRVAKAINSIGIKSTRTAYRSPWQNGIAERWVGTVKRELLEHVIVIDEKHLRRLLREYVDYYNEARVHTCLRDSPNGQRTENRPSADADIDGLPRVGGLHHRYVWREAA